MAANAMLSPLSFSSRSVVRVPTADPPPPGPVRASRLVRKAALPRARLGSRCVPTAPGARPALARAAPGVRSHRAARPPCDCGGGQRVPGPRRRRHRQSAARAERRRGVGNALRGKRLRGAQGQQRRWRSSRSGRGSGGGGGCGGGGRPACRALVHCIRGCGGQRRRGKRRPRRRQAGLERALRVASF